MSSYVVFECERCGTKVASDELPRYWMELTINRDDNPPNENVGKRLQLCTDCSRKINNELKRQPEARKVQE